MFLYTQIEGAPSVCV